ncbi:MAG TPA: OB-fold nucleic acid binding domain-containing protein, partial [Anaerolineaceae bacterium]
MERERSALEQTRYEKIQRLRGEGIEPYPTRAEVTHTAAEARTLFEKSEADGASQPPAATLAGRLRAIRPMGKITFAHIEDSSGRIQLFFRANELGQESLDAFNRDYDLGDYIQAQGTLFRTRTGEVTLQVQAYKMLAKALSPLPAAKDEMVNGEVVRHAALTDPETRFRQRYADLAVNPEVREIFKLRTAVVRALREFLDDRSFLEVETPILQPL